MICKSYGVETTIRHVECELIVGKNNRCIKCRNYRPCLRALQSKQHNQKKKKNLDHKVWLILLQTTAIKLKKIVHPNLMKEKRNKSIVVRKCLPSKTNS